MEGNKTIAVIGAGTMGVGIAIQYALFGHRVALYSRSTQTLDRAHTTIMESCALMAQEKFAPAEAIARVIIEAEGKEFVRPGLHETLEQAVKLGFFPADAVWDDPMTRREGAILALKLLKGGENP